MTILAAESLTKSFAGLVAVNDVSFEVAEGEIVGLIGPNGAGKTTLFNLLAGSLTPTSGRVIFEGNDITGRPAHLIARSGLGRTFQLMKPFGSLSVVDNVVVAAQIHADSYDEAVADAHAVLDRVGLADQAERNAEVLPTAGRKRLEVARALATRPRLLLLDEVLSGLVPSERAPVLDMLRKIREQGTALMFVEHVMAAVMSLSDRVLVLHHGELLADGSPDQITQDPAVIEAYLGEEDMLSADS